MISQAELRALLDYDPATGVFRWRVANSRRVKVGDEAGCLCKRSGYVVLGIKGRVYKANRVAWLYMTGAWPVGIVDHINTDRSDDTWINLRLASQSENLCNRGKQKNNTSGFKGVTYHRQSGKWQAKICVNNDRRHIGLFKTKIEAHAAYATEAGKLHGAFARAE